jgi:hypothetical protein
LSPFFVDTEFVRKTESDQAHIGVAENMDWLRLAWKDPVWSKVISTAIVGAIAIIGGGCVHFLGITWAMLSGVAATGLAYELSDVTVPEWNIALFFAVPTLLVMWICYLLLSPKPVSTKDRPQPVHAPAQEPTPQQAYQSDVLFKFKWRWRLSNTGEVWEAKMYCPKCDHELLESNFEEVAYRASVQMRQL